MKYTISYVNQKSLKVLGKEILNARLTKGALNGGKNLYKEIKKLLE